MTETECGLCERIITIEQALDKRAVELTERVNDLCRDARERNNKRWEDFAFWVRVPIIGGIAYKSSRKTPMNLEREPDYGKDAFYKTEGNAIEKEAEKLEVLKKEHLEHWGNEMVEAGFSWDYAGYYMHCHPKSPMPRRVAYQSYEVYETERGKVSNGKSQLMVFIPKKYDFFSAAGSDKLHEGEMVMDSKTKKIVPYVKCNWSWDINKGMEYHFRGK